MRKSSGGDPKLGQTLESLPLQERAKRYRQFADEAFRQAGQSANPDLRAGLLSMAAGWHALATELDSVIRVARAEAEPSSTSIPVAD